MAIEVGITNQDLLTTVENGKTRKYDLLANEFSMVYKCQVKIIPYAMNWDGIGATSHNNHFKAIKA